MADSKAPCSKQRKILLEVFLSEGEKANLPSDLNRHLENCASCSLYWSNLRAVRSEYQPDRLYSPFLRAKTLRRLADRDQALKASWMPFIVLAALLSLSFSFVLPVWLLTKLFMYWIPSTAVAGGAAMGILLVGGTLATAISAISLMERGYIHFSDEEGIQGRTAFASTARIHEFPSI
jgi:hypothetical protein